MDGRFGGNQLADLVTGSDTAQIRRYNHQELPTYGRLRSMTKRQVQAMIQALVRQGYLRSEGLRYPLLGITELGREVMHNRTVARLGSWEPASPKKTPRDRPATEPEAAVIPTPKHGVLRQALREWRSRKSQEMGVPPYTLFWDRTLDELCVRRPSTQDELAAVWGIGEEKRRKFGAEILAVIAGCTE